MAWLAAVVHQLDAFEGAAQRGAGRDRLAGGILGRDLDPIEALGQGLTALVAAVPGDAVVTALALALAGCDQAAGLVVDADRDLARRLVQGGG
jgi:hypothetical protein